jgi:hemerythrin superfamily protein
MEQGANVVTELTADHREVEELFTLIQALSPGVERRKQLLDQAAIKLMRHTVAEELHLYPAVREHLPDGGSLADKKIQDHAQVEKLLTDLEHCPVGRPEFDRLVARLIFEVSEHVADEENLLFPMLQDACSPEVLNKLGDKVREAKETAPTGPRPSAIDAAPGNKSSVPGRLIDRARDFVSGRGRSPG